MRALPFARRGAAAASLGLALSALAVSTASPTASADSLPRTPQPLKLFGLGPAGRTAGYVGDAGGLHVDRVTGITTTTTQLGAVTRVGWDGDHGIDQSGLHLYDLVTGAATTLPGQMSSTYGDLHARLLAGIIGNQPQVIDVATGEVVTFLPANPTAMSASGRYVAIGRSVGIDGRVTGFETFLFDLGNGASTPITSPGDGLGIPLAVADDGSVLLSRGTSGLAVMFNPFTGVRTSVPGVVVDDSVAHPVPAISSDGVKVLTRVDGQIGVWDNRLRAVQVLGAWPPASEAGATEYSEVRMSPDGSVVAYSVSEQVPDGSFQWTTRLVAYDVPGRTSAHLAAEETLHLAVAGQHGVPVDVAAVALNVTVTDASASGFVTVFPCGGDLPTASNLNYVAGDTVPNATVVKPGADGEVCFFTKAAVDLVIDLQGYFPASAPLTAFTPVRKLDTRDGTGAPAGKVAAGTSVRVQVTGGGVPTGAAAVLNITVTDPDASGFVTAYPCTADVPTASNVNHVAPDTRPNAVVTRLDANGGVCLFTKSRTHLVVDVSGIIASTPGFVSFAPVRVLDTRVAIGTPGTARLAGGTEVALDLSGVTDVTASATAVVLNVTATDAIGPGFVTVHPCGEALPNASNVNHGASSAAANLVVASLGSNHRVCLYAQTGVHLVVDIAGAFVGADSYVGLSPVRLLDSRNLG